MSQSKTALHIGVFETSSILCIALTIIWFAGMLVYAAARHRGLL